MIASWIVVIATTVIAASTVVYTRYAIRLWRETQRATEIARWTAFFEGIVHLHELATRAAEADPAGARLLESALALFMRVGMSRLLKEVDLEGSPEAVAMLGELRGLLRAYGIEPNTTPGLEWLREP